MYEVTRFGWTRTPEELKKLKENKWYRLKTNWLFFKDHVKYFFIWWKWDYRDIKQSLDPLWWNLKNLIFNRNNF